MSLIPANNNNNNNNTAQHKITCARQMLYTSTLTGDVNVLLYFSTLCLQSRQDGRRTYHQIPKFLFLHLQPAAISTGGFIMCARRHDGHERSGTNVEKLSSMDPALRSRVSETNPMSLKPTPISSGSINSPEIACSYSFVGTCSHSNIILLKKKLNQHIFCT